MARVRCPCGEIGRRAALKMRYRKMCWFESGQGHQFPVLVELLPLLIGRLVEPAGNPGGYETGERDV
jgi:hypothetical protein